MRQASISKIPIVIYVKQVAKDEENRVVRTVCLLFTRTLNGYERTFIPESAHFLKKPSFILTGVMQRPIDELCHQQVSLNEIFKHDIIDLILMNSADHIQSLDPVKNTLIESLADQRFLSYRRDAKRLGCSLSNPSLFFINHAFCATIGTQKILKRRFEVSALLKAYQPLLTKGLLEKILEFTEVV